MGTPAIPGFERLSQENHKFEANLGFIGRPSLKKKKVIITRSRRE
jgi:hypothetical protein